MAGDAQPFDPSPEPGLGAPRVCGNGHTVTEDYLKVCPRCGLALAPATAKAPSLAPPAERPVVSKTGPFLVGGLILALFGGVLVAAAEKGPAEDFGWLLVAAGVVVIVIGIVDTVRRH